MTQPKSAVATMNQVSAKIVALSPDQITSITLADGEHEVSNCESVQFAVGEAHSPISPSKFYPYLRYTDTQTGRVCLTPWRAVQAISDGSSSPSRTNFVSSESSS